MNMKKWCAVSSLTLLLTFAMAIPAMAAETETGSVTETQQVEEQSMVEVRETANVLLDADLTADQTLTITALNMAYPITISDTAVASDYDWTSSNTAYVTVSAAGEITAVAKPSGSTAITVTATAKEGTAADPATYVVEVKFGTLLNGICKDPTGQSSSYYYFVNGKVQNVTDVKKIGTDWYNLVNGKVTGNTVAKNSYGWWYINSAGKVDFSYKGFASNSHGYWYCEGGQVKFNKNGVIQDTTGAIGTKGTWYYVKGSEVQKDYTGVADYSNASGWWYVRNGAVDFSANTVAKNKYGWWYVKGGKVQFSYNGFGSNSSGYWYCEGGKVKFNKNSVIQDTTGAIGTKGTWYYVTGSKVQTGYSGVANYKNDYGWWYIENGKVDFTFTGIAQNKYGWWYVVNGKVNFNHTVSVETSMASQVLTLVNQQRSAAGLSSLSMPSIYQTMATQRAF